jgi:hypothetical protein
VVVELEVVELVVAGAEVFWDFPCDFDLPFAFEVVVLVLVELVVAEVEPVELDVVGADLLLDFPCDFAFAFEVVVAAVDVVVAEVCVAEELLCFDFPCDLDFPVLAGAELTVGDFVSHGPTVSPCFRCAGRAFCEIEIVTFGWDFEPVRWQTTTFLPYWYW